MKWSVTYAISATKEDNFGPVWSMSVCTMIFVRGNSRYAAAKNDCYTHTIATLSTSVPHTTNHDSLF